MANKYIQPDFVILPLVQPNPDGNDIELEKIKKITVDTLEEYPPEDRCLAWLALLGVYPSDPNKWIDARTEMHENYWSFVKEFGVEKWHEVELPDHVLAEDIDVPNKPLMAQIHCDIVRTGRQIMFYPPDPTLPKPKSEIMGPFVHYMRRIERILYIFGSFNRSLSYTQGFNELVTPLYFVVLKAQAIYRGNQDLMESVTFSMLQQLITSTPVHEMYTTTDKSSIILHKLGEFTDVMRKHLPAVADAFDKLKIHPALYCYRWFNLLFAQEHDLPSLLLIWDVLFAHIDNFLEFAFYVGIGQLKVIERKIDPTEFSTTIAAVQNLSIDDVVPVIRWATKFWEEDHVPQSALSRLFGRLSF